MERNPPVENVPLGIEGRQLGEEASRDCMKEEQAEIGKRERRDARKDNKMIAVSKILTDSDCDTHKSQKVKGQVEKPMTYAQQRSVICRTFFGQIRTAAANLQSQNIKRSLKRPSADLEQPSSKKSKSTEVPKSDVLADSTQPSVEVPFSESYNSMIYCHGLGWNHMSLYRRYTLANAHKVLEIFCTLVTKVDLMTILAETMTLLSEIRKLWELFFHWKYWLEICHDTVGNELTTAVQLIAFLKKQIADSRCPNVHDWHC
ncbi:hypothetical protein Tco_1000305 [Tanacetum coccineum]